MTHRKTQQLNKFQLRPGGRRLLAVLAAAMAFAGKNAASPVRLILTSQSQTKLGFHLALVLGTAVWGIGSDLRAQIRLESQANGGGDVLAAVGYESSGMQSKGTEELPIQPAGTTLRVVGVNPSGQLEYSVLENAHELLPSRPLKLTQPDPRSIAATAELNNWLTKLVLAHIPHEYVQDKKWGGQVRHWSGVAVRRDSPQGKLETNRRYKMVNHGDWQKYSAKLSDPENKFSVQLVRVALTPENKAAYEFKFQSDLQMEARLAKWVKGIQAYSISAEGHARVALNLIFVLDMRLDWNQLPPDLVFSPQVASAKIQIEEFRLDRVSKVGGEIAQQLSRLARRELESQIHAKEEKLVQKLNKEIADNRDRLRLSIAEAVQLKWYEPSRPFLPNEVRKTISDAGAAPPSVLVATENNSGHLRRQ